MLYQPAIAGSADLIYPACGYFLSEAGLNMIRKFLPDFKAVIQCSSKTEYLYDRMLKEMHVGMLVCPSCGRRFGCEIHGWYTRNTIAFIDGKTVYTKIRVIRVKCRGCGHTHAVLPDAIIPYSQYSVLFLLQVLCDYYYRQMTVEAICGKYTISESMLYRWINLFIKHKEQFLGMLRNMETSAKEFMAYIRERNAYSDFLIPFLEKTMVNFLQNHMNPANCRSRPPGFNFT